MLKCRECRECNGIACRGEIPGLGGKDSGASFIRNVEAWHHVKINMDVLADVREVSTASTVLGIPMALPVFAAPVAGIRNNYGADLSEYEYNCRVLDACEKTGIRAFTGDGIDLENLFLKPAQAVNDHGGHGIVTIKPWVKSGVDARIEALSHLHYELAAMDVDAAGLPLLRAGRVPVENKTADSLRYVKERIGKPFVVKGVMSVSAAETALAAGADGIVVSNHGGRVLDEAMGTAEVLPEIAAAVKGRMSVLVDGGIRSGMDIFKALALGADGVLIGRPLALAAVRDGADGEAALIRKYQDQLAQTMRMTGCGSIADIRRDMVRCVNW